MIKTKQRNGKNELIFHRRRNFLSYRDHFLYFLSKSKHSGKLEQIQETPKNADCRNPENRIF